MKHKYLVIALLLMFFSICEAKALTVGDCKVLASFKLSSSLDEEKYICKGKEFGKNIDEIYYSGEGSTIKLNKANIYYFSNYEEYDITLNITDSNNISLLHIALSNLKVTGSGSLKFKQNSFVKKVINGEAVYQFEYDGKTLINSDKKIYEGTTLEFADYYETLKEINDLPDEYDLENFGLNQVVDYTKMTSVTVTDSWIDKHIDTELNVSTGDGFGIVEYVKPKETKKEEKKEKEENKQLETDNVILISDKELKKKYELKEEDLSDKEVASKVEDAISDKDLISFYDVSVYNGKKLVSMKNGKYVIKIKISDVKGQYENYQIIYVNDDGEIEEYIDGVVEGEYIVFETSHLSQYGVIGTPIDIEPKVSVIEPVIDNKINVSNIFKVMILLSIVIATIILITFIVIKSGLLPKKKKRKRRIA